MRIAVFVPVDFWWGFFLFVFYVILENIDTEIKISCVKNY